MAQQAILDLARADPVTGRGDDVVVAADEADIALRILRALVASRHPVADELGLRRLGLAPIVQEHHRVGPLHRDLPLLLRLADAAVGPDHRDLMARHRLADEARLDHANRGAGGEHEIALGLAVEFVDGEAERLAPPGERLGSERFSAGRHRAQLEVVASARVLDRPQHAQRRRRDEAIAHAKIGQQAEGFVGVELRRRPRHDRHAVMQRRQQIVEQAAGPCPVRRRPEQVARLRQELMRHLHARQMAEHHPVAMQRTLGIAGGAGGVDHQRRVVSPAVDRREVIAFSFQQAREPFGLSIRAVGRDHQLELRQRLLDLAELGEPGGIGDQRLRSAIAQAIGQRVGAEQCRQRHGDGAELIGCHMGDWHQPPLRQQDRDPVAFADATLAQRIRKTVRLRPQLAIADGHDRPVGLDLQDRDLAGIDGRPAVAAIDADIVALRNPPAEGSAQALIVADIGKHAAGPR